MPTTHNSVSEALFAVQQNLPHVGKDNTADTGKYKYKYADLNQVQDALFPLFAEHQLVWTAGPGYHEGRFGLGYRLTHVPSDTFVDGHYYLPEADSQAIGSALTYARRYALCAVTGLAPGGDDDDGAKTLPKPPEVDEVTASEWVEAINAATTIPALQSVWEAAGKVGATRSDRVMKAKDARKAALAKEAAK